MATTDFGFDFRSTAIYVTDPTYAAPVLGELFPHTYTNGSSQTISAGWAVTLTADVANRNSANDPRLAGINYNHNGNAGSPSFATFHIVMPATGVWTIAAAFGDASTPQIQYVQLLDNAVAFATYTNVSTAANSFMDANGIVWTEANWITSNTTLNHTFGSTVFTVQIGPTTGAGSLSTCVAFLRITQVPTSTLRLLSLTGVGQ